MAALIIDGSNAYLNRRKAQTAADAAALAGAREMCIAKGSTESINDVIEEYALIHNQATGVTWEIDESSQIVVSTSLTASTFFAKVFNQPTSTVNASAAAGCFNPGSGKGMLPVAWACRNIEGTMEWDSEDCKYKALDYETELQPLLQPGFITIGEDVVPTPLDFETYWLSDIYVIMDTASLSDDANGVCQPDGFMDCDFDDDGRDDFLGQGDAAWLDLNGGGGGASELSDWVDNGFPDPIQVHTWVPSQPGDDVSIYHTAADHVGEIVLLPVFNQFCVGDPWLVENQHCLDAAHAYIPLPPDMGSDIFVIGNTQTYYHIIGFAFFYISCVDAPAEQNCPGHALAAVPGGIFDMNGLNPNSTFTIEGYFVTGVPVDFGAAGPGGVDLGAYVLSLTQ
jgi:hypothetical protein